MRGQQIMESRIKNFHIQFKVQAQTAGIQIGRTDLAVIAVHSQQFGMGEGRRLMPDAHAGVEQGRQQAKRGPVHIGQIVPGRKRHAHIHAALARRTQTGHEVMRGQKIRSHDPHSAPRRIDDPAKEVVEHVRIIARAVHDDAAAAFASGLAGARRQRRIFAGAEAPVEQKGAPQMVDNGPQTAKVHVLHAAFPTALQVVVGNVHAAGKACVVTDQDFAVIAQVDAQIEREELGRQKQRRLDALGRKLFPGFAPGIERADAVHQHAHIHAARGRGGQGLNKGRACLPGIKDVGDQKNMVARLRNGVQHGRVGLVAVAQGAERIAAAQGLICQAAAQMRHADDMFRHELRGSRGTGRIRVFRLLGDPLPHDFFGPALCPADAKKHIEQGAQHRQQQGRDGPAQG